MSSATKIDPALCLRIAQTCGFYRLRRAARVVARRIDDAFEDEELTPHQLFLVLGLSLTGGRKMQSLADLLGLDHSTLSRTLAPLLARGMIRHGDGDDRRASPLELTEAGRRCAVRAISSWERFQSSFETSLGAERWARLAADLDAVIALEAPGGAAPPAPPRRPGKRRRARPPRPPSDGRRRPAESAEVSLGGSSAPESRDPTWRELEGRERCAVVDECCLASNGSPRRTRRRGRQIAYLRAFCVGTLTATQENEPPRQLSK